MSRAAAAQQHRPPDREATALTALAGTIAVVGRIETCPRRRLARELERTGAKLARRLTGRCTALVVGHGAVGGLEDGSLPLLIEQADSAGVPVLSENEVLRRLQLAPDLPDENRPLTAAEITSRSGLSQAALRLLHLFDVLEPGPGASFGFRDLVVARNVAALLSAGADLSAAIPALMAAKRFLGRTRQ